MSHPTKKCSVIVRPTRSYSSYILENLRARFHKTNPEKYQENPPLYAPTRVIDIIDSIEFPGTWPRDSGETIRFEIDGIAEFECREGESIDLGSFPIYRTVFHRSDLKFDYLPPTRLKSRVEVGAMYRQALAEEFTCEARESFRSMKVWLDHAEQLGGVVEEDTPDPAFRPFVVPPDEACANQSTLDEWCNAHQDELHAPLFHRSNGLGFEFVGGAKYDPTKADKYCDPIEDPYEKLLFSTTKYRMRGGDMRHDTLIVSRVWLTLKQVENRKRFNSNVITPEVAKQKWDEHRENIWALMEREVIAYRSKIVIPDEFVMVTTSDDYAKVCAIYRGTLLSQEERTFKPEAPTVWRDCIIASGTMTKKTAE